MSSVREEPGGLAVTASSDEALSHYFSAADAMLAGRSDVDDAIESGRGAAALQRLDDRLTRRPSARDRRWRAAIAEATP